MYINFPSKLLEEAVGEFEKLPGVGQKTALRLVLHLLRHERGVLENFGNVLIKLSRDIRYCNICMNISDNDVCPVCADNGRDHSVICVVENIRDVMVIENTHQYKGVYHVLGGIISPMNGVGPADLNIASLETRVKNGAVKEIIFALSATMEGDTTNFYLYRKLSSYLSNISTLARGVSVGDELEYIDEITLGRSIINRIPFNSRQ